MYKILLFVISILPIISIILIFLIKRRKQAIQIYSIQAFLGNSSYNALQEEPDEQEKSLIDMINDFFKDSNDEIADDNGDIDGDDDAGE